MGRAGRATTSVESGIAHRAWRNWAGNQRAAATDVLRPRRVEDVAARSRRCGRRRSADQARRQRPLLHRHRRPPTTVRLHLAALAGVVVGRPGHAAGHRAGRHDRCTRSTGCSRPTAWPCRTSATSTRRPSPARSPPAPTAPAPSTAACPRSCRGLTLVTGAGEVLRCSPRHPAGPLRRRAGRARRARRHRRGDAALRRRLRAACRRTPGRAGRRARRPRRRWSPRTTTSSSTGSRTPTGSRSNATTGCPRTTGRCRGSAAGSTTTCSPTPSSAAPAGSAGPSRRWCRRSAPSRRGRCRPASTPRGPTRSSVRPAGCASSRWSTACPAAACREAIAGLRRIIDDLPFKVLFPVEIRFTAAGRHLAVPRLRPRVGVPRHPPVRRHALRAVLPGVRAGVRRAGRPAALGQAALPRRRLAAPGVPALRRLPAACATGSTRAGSSPTPTPNACWAPDPVR